MTAATYKWSIKDWHQLIESGLLEGKSVQLLDGDIIEMSPEREEHSYTNDDVADLLRQQLKGLAKIRESHPVTLDNSPHSRASEPEPDIAVVRLPKTIYSQHHPYPEDIYWLIEVRPRVGDRRKGMRTCEISNKTLKIDLEQKSKIYARNNIAEYWVIDLVNKKLVVHTQPQGDLYQQITEYKTGTVTPQAFPNIAIQLNKMLLF